MIAVHSHNSKGEQLENEGGVGVKFWVLNQYTLNQ